MLNKKEIREIRRRTRRVNRIRRSSEEIAREYASGATMMEIAKKYGVTQQAIGYHVRRALKLAEQGR